MVTRLAFGAYEEAVKGEVDAYENVAVDREVVADLCELAEQMYVVVDEVFAFLTFVVGSTFQCNLGQKVAYNAPGCGAECAVGQVHVLGPFEDAHEVPGDVLGGNVVALLVL